VILDIWVGIQGTFKMDILANLRLLFNCARKPRHLLPHRHGILLSSAFPNKPLRGRFLS
jgi:hypothetical protein